MWVNELDTSVFLDTEFKFLNICSRTEYFWFLYFHFKPNDNMSKEDEKNLHVKHYLRENRE